MSHSMQPRFETLAEKKLVGRRIRMSLANNKGSQLWGSFMPARKEIRNTIGSEIYALEVYDAGYFDSFNPAAEFDKWAAVAVGDFGDVPASMETITAAGLYAVFLHKGSASSGVKTYEYIFMNWLPNSDFLVDLRPHFAVMGEKYKGEDSASEEELWVPIKPRG